jgi:uncharacterized protein (TIGR02145 family)
MLRLYLLFILAVSLFWGCVSIGFFGEDAIDTCGGEKYRYREQICDDGILKVPCGNGYYDPKVQFCFENAVVEKCADKEYNPLNQKCEGIIILNKCGNDYYNPANYFCSNNDVYDNTIYGKCGDTTHDLATQKCDDNIVKTKCGNGYYNPVTQFCFNSTIYIQCGGKSYNLDAQFCSNNIIYDKCGDKKYAPNASIYCSDDDSLMFDYGTLIDFRDNEVYKTIKIGEQIWMAENLRYESTSECKNDWDWECVWRTRPRCYDRELNNCEVFGMLYGREIAMNEEIYSEAHSNKVRGICPEGWHLPNDTEWRELEKFVGESDAGTKLKANSELWSSGGGTDDFGFNALPGGYHYYLYANGFNSNIFNGKEKFAYFLSTDTHIEQTDTLSHFYRIEKSLSLSTGLESHYINYFTFNSASVRCIKD